MKFKTMFPNGNIGKKRVKLNVKMPKLGDVYMSKLV